MKTTHRLAPTPPLGWNSWDCFGPTVREDEVKANADYMAKYLLPHGWNTIVVDIQWYEPSAQAGGYRPHAHLIVDGYGRLLPALNRFPSAADGAGFKPLADYVHSLGLKFGIHILRGIPRQAVRLHLPILNSTAYADEIANLESVSSWIDDMYGINVQHPAGQAYYDSIIALYEQWEVDFIKADDMLWPYYQGEIEALSRAISKANRDIILSLSPGVELSTDHADHLRQHSQMWRISADFWDRWVDLKAQFETCSRWSPYIAQGAWPDADMLPLGRIGIRAERGIERQSLLTKDEQITLMSLWAIFRSPLMFGGDLPTMDDFTLSLLTNDEVLSVNQASYANRELVRQDDLVAWTADIPNSEDKCLALFNISDVPTAVVGVDFALLGAHTAYKIRDLWNQTDIGVFQNTFQQAVVSHGSKLYRLHPVRD